MWIVIYFKREINWMQERKKQERDKEGREINTGYVD